MVVSDSFNHSEVFGKKAVTEAYTLQKIENGEVSHVSSRENVINMYVRLLLSIPQ